MMNIFNLPDVALNLILLQYLDYKDLVSFDSAICNKQIRDRFIDSTYCNWDIPILKTNLNFFKFAERRQIDIQHLIIEKNSNYNSNNKSDRNSLKKVRKLIKKNLKVKSLEIDMSVVSSYFNKNHSNGDEIIVNLIENIKNLQVLRISYNNASVTTDRILEALVRHQSKSLKSVTFTGCRGYSPNGIASLGSLPFLEEFRLTNTSIDAPSLVVICKNPQLKTLDLSGAFINAHMIELIIPDLSSHIVSLSLADCYMIYGDNAVEIVRQVFKMCLHLKKLDVTGLISSHTEWQRILMAAQNENVNPNNGTNNGDYGEINFIDNDHHENRDILKADKSIMEALGRLQHLSFSYQQSARTTHRFTSEHREQVLLTLLYTLTDVHSLEIYLREDGSLADGAVITAVSTCKHLRRLLVAYDYLSNSGFNRSLLGEGGEVEFLEYGGPDMVISTETLVKLKQLLNDNNCTYNSLAKTFKADSKYRSTNSDSGPLEVVIHGLLEKNALLQLKKIQTKQKQIKKETNTRTLNKSRNVKVVQHDPELPSEFVHDLQTHMVSLHNLFV